MPASFLIYRYSRPEVGMMDEGDKASDQTEKIVLVDTIVI